MGNNREVSNVFYYAAMTTTKYDENRGGKLYLIRGLIPIRLNNSIYFGVIVGHKMLFSSIG